MSHVCIFEGIEIFKVGILIEAIIQVFSKTFIYHMIIPDKNISIHMYIPSSLLYKTGRDGNILKLLFWSRYPSCSNGGGLYNLREGVEWPANPNSDWIHNTAFLTFGLHHWLCHLEKVRYPRLYGLVFHHSSLWILLCLRLIFCLVWSCDKWMFHWNHEYCQSFTPSGLQQLIHADLLI